MLQHLPEVQQVANKFSWSSTGAQGVLGCSTSTRTLGPWAHGPKGLGLWPCARSPWAHWPWAHGS